MGTIELLNYEQVLYIHSNLLFYGKQASQELADYCQKEIQSMWNEPQGKITFQGNTYTVQFVIKSYLFENIKPEDIHNNGNAKNNYFRIEDYVNTDISFVDGVRSNTGFFKLANLVEGSTTAAHEYGHSLGLEHPVSLDYRGKGAPGIMYPRGTLVDARYQWNPAAEAGDSSMGGTMNPSYRKVKQKDIDLLGLNQINLTSPNAIIGAFSSVYHNPHQE